MALGKLGRWGIIPSAILILFILVLQSSKYLVRLQDHTVDDSVSRELDAIIRDPDPANLHKEAFRGVGLLRVPYKGVPSSLNTEVNSWTSSINNLTTTKTVLHTRDPLPLPKPASDELWAKFQRKGCSVIRFMDMSLEEAQANAQSGTAQSPWTNTDALDNWGWEGRPYFPAPLKFGAGDSNSYLHIQSAIESLDLDATEAKDAQASKNWLRRLVHNKVKTVDRVEYPATTGYFINIYNTAQGAIYALSNYSPAFMKGMDPDLAEAPIIKLKQWSDVTFLTYSLMAKAQNNPVNKLRHIFRHNIATLETRETIRRALEQEYQVSQPSAWPGQKFNGEHVEAFNAMMGTPHGSAAAFVAAQHKQQLGLKRVNEVTIFRDSSENRGWHLVFTFEDFGT